MVRWLTHTWQYLLGDEYYEARVGLPIEVVWSHFHRVVDNSRRPDFWKVQHNITGSLYDSYRFRMEGIVQTGGTQVNLQGLFPPGEIVGGMQPASPDQTVIRYRVQLGPSLIILALLSLPISIGLIVWAFPSKLDSGSIIGFVLAVGIAAFIPAIQFGLAQQQKLDIHRAFRGAFGIRSVAVPKPKQAH